MQLTACLYKSGGTIIMSKKSRIIIITIFFALLSGLFSSFNDVVYTAVSVISSGIVSAATASLYEMIDTKGQGYKLWFQSRILYRKQDIYISFSYLYKIEVDGRYLLIRGNRFKNRFQPVGGVYKYYPEAKQFLESINFSPNYNVVNSYGEENDLRINIKGEKVLDFFEWFLKMENREYDPRREFFEELVKTGFIDGEMFENFNYRKIGKRNKSITKSYIRNGNRELIYADIFELKLDKRQIEALKDAVEKNIYAGFGYWWTFSYTYSSICINRRRRYYRCRNSCSRRRSNKPINCHRRRLHHQHLRISGS